MPSSARRFAQGCVARRVDLGIDPYDLLSVYIMSTCWQGHHGGKGFSVVFARKAAAQGAHDFLAGAKPNLCALLAGMELCHAV